MAWINYMYSTSIPQLNLYRLQQFDKTVMALWVISMTFLSLATVATSKQKGNTGNRCNTFCIFSQSLRDYY